MLGGVWEWCWDQYDVEVYGSYRVIRGGGWSDPHWSCRVGVRRKTNPQAALDDLGFRLARTITA
jgi:formylglycine-generating enzyme required for sulfatase activity